MIGIAVPSLNDDFRACVWENGRRIDLQGVFRAQGINERGDICCWSHPGALLLMAGGKQIKLPSSGKGDPFAQSLNNQDVVAGADYIGSDPRPQSVLWIKGREVGLGCLPTYSRSWPLCVNGDRSVVGVCANNTLTRSMGYVCWKGGKMTPVGTLGGSTSFCRSINNFGVIVGTSKNAKGIAHAFIYFGSRIHDLNLLIPANSGWILSIAKSINDKGEIVGDGICKGRHIAFLLEPLKS
jgi:probable HAF family extracellular repeat protein